MQLFQSTPDNELIKEKIWEAFGQLKRGDTVPWEIFDRVTGHHHLDKPFFYEWYQRKMLAEYGYYVTVDHSQGLRVCTIYQQVLDEIEARDAKVKRQRNRQVNMIRRLSVDECNDHQRRLRSSQLEKAERDRRMAEQSRRSTTALLKTTETNFRRINKHA